MGWNRVVTVVCVSWNRVVTAVCGLALGHPTSALFPSCLEEPSFIPPSSHHAFAMEVNFPPACLPELLIPAFLLTQLSVSGVITTTVVKVSKAAVSGQGIHDSSRTDGMYKRCLPVSWGSRRVRRGCSPKGC